MVKIFILILLLRASIVNAQQVFSTPEHLPIFDGDLMEYIQFQISYPHDAIEQQLEDTVFVSFIVDTLGHTFNHTIEKGRYIILNKEAIRVARTIMFVNPAQNRGRAIEFNYIIPIDFKLSKQKGKRCK